ALVLAVALPARSRIAVIARCRTPAIRPLVARLHADFVVDVLDAAACVGDVLDAMLDAAPLDIAAQGDFAVLHFDRHVAGIHVVGIPQPFGDVFLDAFVAARVILRAAAAIAARQRLAAAFTVTPRLVALQAFIVAAVGAAHACVAAPAGAIAPGVAAAPAAAGETRPLFAVTFAVAAVLVAIAGAIEGFRRARGAVILRHVLRAPALAELVAIIGFGVAPRGISDAVVFVVG